MYKYFLSLLKSFFKYLTDDGSDYEEKEEDANDVIEKVFNTPTNINICKFKD